MAVGILVLWENEKIVSRLGWRVATIFLCLVIAGLSFRQIRTEIPKPDETWPRVTFGQRVNQLTEPDALMIFVYPRLEGIWRPEMLQRRTAQGAYIAVDPIDFYLSHRKGWSLDDVLATPAFVETRRQRGAKYFATFFPEIFDRHPDLRSALERNYQRVEVTPQWAIYRLEKPHLNQAMEVGTSGSR
jgi:hypothetical protein